MVSEYLDQSGKASEAYASIESYHPTAPMAEQTEVESTMVRDNLLRGRITQQQVVEGANLPPRVQDPRNERPLAPGEIPSAPPARTPHSFPIQTDPLLEHGG